MAKGWTTGEERRLERETLTFSSVTAAGVLRRMVPKSEVFLVKADMKYLAFYTQASIHIGAGSLEALEVSWGDEWIRVHRSTLVRKAAIVAITPSDCAVKLILQFGSRTETVTVSRRRASAVRKLFK